MPDVSGSAAIDVAIGLAFLFFLLSVICSAINEALASVLGWRAKTLEEGLHSLLGDPALKPEARSALGRVTHEVREPRDERQAAEIRGLSGLPHDLAGVVLSQPSVRALVRDPQSPRRRRSRPSYLPPEVMSRAVVETLALGPPVEGGTGESLWEKSDAQVFGMVRSRLEGLPPAGSRSLLLKAMADADGSVERFRRSLEGMFDEVMGRAAGWYKRRVQTALAVIAAAIAIGMNVDTVHVGQRLWQDDAVRAAAVAQATAARGEAPTRAAAAVEAVEALNLPIGWGAGNGLRATSIPGWLATIFAIELGAPFWFDALGRVANLRGAGARPSG